MKHHLAENAKHTRRAPSESEMTLVEKLTAASWRENNHENGTVLLLKDAIAIVKAHEAVSMDSLIDSCENAQELADKVSAGEPK